MSDLDYQKIETRRWWIRSAAVILVLAKLTLRENEDRVSTTSTPFTRKVL